MPSASASSAQSPPPRQGVELVSVAAVALRDVRTTALVDLAWTVADAASVKRAAVVHVVADAIGIASSARHRHTRQGVSWFPSQSQSPSGCPHNRTRRSRLDRCRAASVKRPRSRPRRHRCHRHRRLQQSPPPLQSVELVSIAVAVALRDVRTSALVNLTWAIADAARIKRAYAVVHVVTDAIGIGVFSASPPPLQERRAGFHRSRSRPQDVCTTALVDLAWTVAGRKRQARPRSRPRRRRCHRHRRLQRVTATPKASSWFPSQS